MKRVEHAAKTANADEFIRNLPEGYNTGIGPRGSSLSGGQRQRLVKKSDYFIQNQFHIVLLLTMAICAD